MHTMRSSNFPLSICLFTEDKQVAKTSYSLIFRLGLIDYEISSIIILLQQSSIRVGYVIFYM